MPVVCLAPFDAADYLRDSAAMATFLNAALEDGDPEVFLQAVRTVARARGMSQLARDTGLGRESLYKALAPGAKPRYDTLFEAGAGPRRAAACRCGVNLLPRTPGNGKH